MTLAEFLVLPRETRRRRVEEFVQRQRIAMAESHPAIQAAIRAKDKATDKRPGA